VNFTSNAVSILMGTSATSKALTISKAGSGSGTVTSSPARISCGPTCSAPFNAGQVVTLVETPAADSIFIGWSGDADCQDASVTMSVDHSCIATFSHITLTVSKTGEGDGLVTSTPAGLNCGTTCSSSFLPGQVVTLTVTPAFGSVFSGWSGDADCSDGSVTMSADHSCVATFSFNSFNPLTITRTGYGSGTVTSLGGLNCGPTCEAAIPRGEILALTATPAPGSVFGGWSGDADCVDGSLTMITARNCSARFDLPQTNSTLLRGDFDGDGKTDLAVYRASTGEWFLRLSTQRYAIGGGNWYFVWGVAGDVPLTGDFDGDGKTDIAVYRPSTGEWFLRLSTQNYAITFGNWYFQWGTPGDVPITGDFDHDGKTDIAVYRPSTGEWFIRLSTQNYVIGAGNWNFQWGVPDDQPVAGDFDGDGKTDIAVYRPSTGEWFIRFSTLNYAIASGNWYFHWGVPGDQPLAGDYDGDGKTDIAVYRPSTGEWFLLLSSTGYVNEKGNWHFHWGIPGDLTIRGDFDGDSKADIAVFRPSTGEWYIQLSTYDYALAWYFVWGMPGDVPLRR
jgi:beta-galactosidase beta subunit